MERPRYESTLQHDVVSVFGDSPELVFHLSDFATSKGEIPQRSGDRTLGQSE